MQDSVWQILKTGDGSVTLLNQDGITYHSRHGAIEESRVVFIEAGLDRLVSEGRKEIDILEAGFGSGLNALMSLQYSRQQGVKLRYTALEKYPLPLQLLQEIQHPAFTGFPEDEPLFLRMHAAVSKGTVQITDAFSINIVQQNIEDYCVPESADLVYFDAFAPSAQPELWTEDVFRNLYTTLKRGGILVTYCSKSVVRKAMTAAGFVVEKLPGPKGKREIVRASR